MNESSNVFLYTAFPSPVAPASPQVDPAPGEHQGPEEGGGLVVQADPAGEEASLPGPRLRPLAG